MGKTNAQPVGRVASHGVRRHLVASAWPVPDRRVLMYPHAMRSTALTLACVALASCSHQRSTNGAEGLPTVMMLRATALNSSSGVVIHEYVVGSRSIVLELDAEDTPAPVMTYADLPDSTKVWADGRFCCVRSGKYREGRVEPAKIDALLQHLHTKGAFGDGHASYSCVAPDSVYSVIDVTLRDRSIHLATDRGFEELDQLAQGVVLASQSPDYQGLRRIWTDIHSTVEEWVSANEMQSPR